MNFESNHLYHIYNQGNNKQKIFFEDKNYLFFIEKIKLHILPFADIIAWCLMPNHFHLMVYINRIEIQSSHGFPQSEAMTKPKTQSLNDSIGIMLRSYTRAINKQEGTSGSLFRPQTKAECLSKSNGTTPSYIDTSEGTQIYIYNHEKEYPAVCFNYIHENPVKAKLVKKSEDWMFSSFIGYKDLSNDIMTNILRAKEWGLI